MRKKTPAAPPTSSSRCLLLPLLLTFLSLLIKPIYSIHHPLIHEIRARRKECVYHRFERGDFATFELFIVDSDEKGKPEAAVMIEGPVVGAHVGKIDENGERKWDEPGKAMNNAGEVVDRKSSMGRLMQVSMQKWPNFVRNNGRNFQELGLIHHSFHIDYTHSGENEDAIAARADLSRQQSAEAEERRKRNMEREKMRKEGHDYTGKENIEDEKYEFEHHVIHQIIPEFVEPYEWTKPIKAAGWYRMCVTAEKYIAVEMDIRSGAELGGIDPETWHVYTHDDREEIDEEERLEELERLQEEAEAKQIEDKLVAEELDRVLKDQVKGKDLDTTRKLMREVKTAISEIQKRQMEARKRLKSHEGDARRNYRRILRSGGIETVLYVLITVMQVYTVHKWLLSNNILGR